MSPACKFASRARPFARIAVRTTSVFLALGAAACGEAPDETPAPRTDPYVSTVDASPALTEADFGDLDSAEVALDLPWGRGAVSRKAGAGAEATRLTGVRTWSGEGFDRVVFSFAPTLPGYRVARVDAAGTGCDGSGPVPDAPVALRVGLESARVEADVADGGARDMADLPIALGAEVSCLEGARVEWLLGLVEGVEHRIFEMRGEARLVVDVRRPAEGAH